MRWLLCGNLDPAVSEALTRHGDSSQSPADIGLAEGATAPEIFEAAQKKQLDLLTNDPVLARAPFEQTIDFNRSLVFFQLPGGAVEQDDAVDRLFKRYKRLSPGQLYTVTESRVKVRQLPGTRGK